jgi:hypothetical protein
MGKTSKFAHGVLTAPLQDFQFTQKDLKQIEALHKSSAEKNAKTKSKDNTYTVLLINISAICITLARTRPAGTSKWGAFFPTQRICHNCDHGYDQCYEDHDWAPVMSTNCGAAPFDLMIIDTPDAQGNAQGGIYTISPTCSFAGGVIGLG